MSGEFTNELHIYVNATYSDNWEGTGKVKSLCYDVYIGNKHIISYDSFSDLVEYLDNELMEHLK